MFPQQTFETQYPYRCQTKSMAQKFEKARQDVPKWVIYQNIAKNIKGYSPRHLSREIPLP